MKFNFSSESRKYNSSIVNVRLKVNSSSDHIMSDIKLVIGKEAFELFNSKDFITKWKQLAKDTFGFSHLQEPEFAVTWYQHYQSEYDPVLSILFGGKNKIRALMCLALHKNKKYITHAGHDNAEYHGWLSLPEDENLFIARTIKGVSKAFLIKKWPWSWLPPDKTIDAFSNLEKSGIYINFEQNHSLLWNLEDGEKLQKLKKSRSIKSKFNRLNRRGNLQFRLITDERETFQILQKVKYQNDFRHEAIHNTRPFSTNKNKIAFCSARQKFESAIHVSGLWLDDQLLSFHLGICDKERVCLGITSYDPSESKFSPGTLHMIKLGEALTDQGFKMFDLTPGKDVYKERFANSNQQIWRPTFYFSKRAKLKGRIKNTVVTTIKKILQIVNIQESVVTDWVDQINEFRLKKFQVNFFDCVRILFNYIFIVSKVYIYRSKNKISTYEKMNGTVINIQQYEDILKFESSRYYRSRRDLLLDSIFRFSKGDVLFSSSKENRLNWLCWQATTQHPILTKAYPNDIELKGNGLVLYDFFQHKDLKYNDYLNNIEQSLNYLREHHTDHIYLVFDKKEKLLDYKKVNWNIDELQVLSCIRLFWFIKFNFRKVLFLGSI